MERKRTLFPRKSSLRISLENYVVAWNTCLRKTVGTMDVISLLRNANPSYRSSFAKECMDAGMISPFAASEFIAGPVKRSSY